MFGAKLRIILALEKLRGRFSGQGRPPARLHFVFHCARAPTVASGHACPPPSPPPSAAARPARSQDRRGGRPAAGARRRPRAGVLARGGCPRRRARRLRERTGERHGHRAHRRRRTSPRRACDSSRPPRAGLRSCDARHERVRQHAHAHARAHAHAHAHATHKSSRGAARRVNGGGFMCSWRPSGGSTPGRPVHVGREPGHVWA